MEAPAVVAGAGTASVRCGAGRLAELVEQPDAMSETLAASKADFHMKASSKGG